MPLKEYRRKRHFERTPEPAGKHQPGAKRRRTFVVQKHDASHLHYDFRLELGGVLKSWAVPKGPSLNPADKRLAVEVEDHPLAYGNFEGTIPKGEYGGGTVIVWDRGTWTPEDNTSPAAALAAGALKFQLHGKKLKGNWTLIRTAATAGKKRVHWLLMKRRDTDPPPAYDVLKRFPESVKSGRTIAEVAAGKKSKARKMAKSSRTTVRRRAAKRGTTIHEENTAPKNGRTSARGQNQDRLPTWVEPQLARLASTPPSGAHWIHETKFDGYRLIAIVHGREVALMTRGKQNWSDRFPRLAKQLAALRLKSAVLDGEVVILDAHGVSNFQLLQNSLRTGDDTQMRYFAFDLLFLNGLDLRRLPLAERKAALAQLLEKQGPRDMVQYSRHVSAGTKFYQLSCRHGLEGIVSKRTDLPYQSGRGDSWLKSKCGHREEFVIGGYTNPSGSRIGFGSILLGYYDTAGRLQYCGHVGTGFSMSSLLDLKRRFISLAQERSPFANTKAIPRSRANHWVEPKLVCEIRFSNWTNDDILRHASFQGLREDKPAREVRRDTVEVKRRQPASARGAKAS